MLFRSGPTGPTGPIGATGPQGPTGNDGPAGPEGPAGTPGAAGPQGPQGNTGAQGPAGTTPTVAVGTTITGAPGTPANVTDSGTPIAAVFNFTIPQGIAGPTGSPGAQGLPGASSFTTVSTSFTIPPAGQTVVVNVVDSSWAVVGQVVYVDTAGGGAGKPGAMQVTAKGSSPNTLTLLNPSSTANAYVAEAPLDGGLYGRQNAAWSLVGVSSLPLADNTQNGLLKKLSFNTTDFVDGTNNCQDLATAVRPAITSVRLRSFNAIGNPTMECNQRLPGGTVTASGWALDRWIYSKVAATAVVSAQQATPAGGVTLPGTNFIVSQNAFSLTLTTAQATLAAGEYICFFQKIEGPLLRELIGDVHSASVLAYCTQPITFSVTILSNSGTIYSLTKLCTIPANAWTLVTLPNLPLWPSAATWPLAPGNAGYQMTIALACGSTYTSPANDAWVAGNFIAGPGTTNFASLPTGTVFQLAFAQHEPGQVCTTLIDKPFTQNYDECLRYYCKSYDYGVKAGTTTSAGRVSFASIANYSSVFGMIRFPKPMAVKPSLTFWSPSNGGVNIINGNGGGNYTAGSMPDLSTTGVCNIMTTPVNAAGGDLILWSHFAADTGW